jgi:hypothetical protein
MKLVSLPVHEILNMLSYMGSNKIHIHFNNYHNFGHYPSCLLYKKHYGLDSGFCLHLQVEPTQMGPEDKR